MSTESRPRTDVQRNDEAILSAAIAVLALSPQATMQEIANASGVGRSTLYRHYPDRTALLDAIYARVFAEGGEIVREHLEGSDDADALRVLVDLAAALAGLGDRYPFLERGETAGPRRWVRKPREGRVERYLEAAQRRGVIRADLDAGWLVALFRSVVSSAALHPFLDAGERRRSVEVAVTSLLTPP